MISFSIMNNSASIQDVDEQCCVDQLLTFIGERNYFKRSAAHYLYPKEKHLIVLYTLTGQIYGGSRFIQISTPRYSWKRRLYWQKNTSTHPRHPVLLRFCKVLPWLWVERRSWTWKHQYNHGDIFKKCRPPSFWFLTFFKIKTCF